MEQNPRIQWYPSIATGNHTKYCSLGSGSGYPAANVNFTVHYPLTTEPPIIVLEYDESSSAR